MAGQLDQVILDLVTSDPTLSDRERIFVARCTFAAMTHLDEDPTFGLELQRPEDLARVLSPLFAAIQCYAAEAWCATGAVAESRDAA